MTFSALSRMSAVYPSMGPSLSSGFVSSFCLPILEQRRAICHSITPGSPDGIHRRIVGLFAPVLRSTQDHEEDLLVKSAPQGLDSDPIGYYRSKVRLFIGRFREFNHLKLIDKVHYNRH